MYVPDGWSEEKLRDLFEFKNGANTEAANYGSGIKFVNVMDILGNNFLTYEKIRESVNLPSKKADLYRLKIGDVLFNRTSETADEIALSSVYLDSKLAIFGGFVIRGRPVSNRLTPQFCIYCFSSSNVRKELIRRGQGAIRANIGQADMRNVPLLVPPLSEQQKIAQILSTWDKAIEKLEALIAAKQKRKKALMQQLLTGKMRFAGFDGEWNKRTIKQMGKVVAGGTPDTNINEYWEGDILWMTPTDVTALQTRLINNTKRKITQEGVKNSSATVVPSGSLLVCTRATIGVMSISTTDITTNQGFKNLVPSSKFEVNFLYYLFNFFKKEFIRYACGSTFFELSKQDFEKLVFECPELKEQQKIASVLSAADNEIATHKNQLAALKQQKTGLMQQLLTGK